MLLRLVRPQQPRLLRALSPTFPPLHLLIFSFLSLLICGERGWVEIFLGVYPPLPFSGTVCVCVCRRACEAQLGGVFVCCQKGAQYLSTAYGRLCLV